MITNKIHTAIQLITSNRRQFLMSIAEKFRFLFSNDTFIKLRFRIMMGYRLNVNNPKTFCEKIQWLKLFNHHDLYHMMVDKLEVKDYVSKLIGSQYVVPTYAQYESFEQFNIDELPERFIIKSSNGGGGGVLPCLDKKTLNLNAVKDIFDHMYNVDIYRLYGEWAYKDANPKVIVEELLVENNNPGKPLTDYKFFCFNGEPTFCQVIKGRDSLETIDFFDQDWNHLSFIGLNEKAIHSKTPIEKPARLNEMISIARKLSHDIPFVRIDLYEVNERVYFGEITFYPASGIGRFSPAEYDMILGDKILLPNK